MTTTLNNILIFKTNIRTEDDKSRIQNSLNNREDIQQWNIDLKDVDCVLRIISDSITIEDVISIVTNSGFECVELE